MDMDQRQRVFMEQMQVLVETWTAPEMSDMRLGAYWQGLKDLDEGLLVAAVQACVRTSEFFPTVARIRNEAERLLEAAGRFPMDADSAWTVVMERAKRWVPGASTRFDDDLINQAVKEIGGLGYIAMASNEQIGYIQNHFATRYTTLRRRAIDRQPLPSLPVVDEDVALAEHSTAHRQPKELEA